MVTSGTFASYTTSSTASTSSAADRHVEKGQGRVKKPSQDDDNQADGLSDCIVRRVSSCSVTSAIIVTASMSEEGRDEIVAVDVSGERNGACKSSNLSHSPDDTAFPVEHAVSKSSSSIDVSESVGNDGDDGDSQSSPCQLPVNKNFVDSNSSNYNQTENDYTPSDDIPHPVRYSTPTSQSDPKAPDDADTHCHQSSSSAPLQHGALSKPKPDDREYAQNEDEIASSAASISDHAMTSIKVVHALGSNTKLQRHRSIDDVNEDLSEGDKGSNPTSKTGSCADCKSIIATAATIYNDDVPWTAQQHRDFVAAIYDIGLEKCSPSVILDNMRRRAKCITRERAKSHLQKYRQTRDKSKRDFLKEYDSLLASAEMIKEIQTKVNGGKPPLPAAVLTTALRGQAPETLIGGDVAALLAFSVLNGISADQNPDDISFNATPEAFPILTEREQKSSLGQSLMQVTGMLQNLTNVLLKARHNIIDIFPEGQGYESPSCSEDDDEEEEDEFEGAFEKETAKEDAGMPLVGRKASPSTVSSSGSYQNHRPTVPSTQTGNPLKKNIHPVQGQVHAPPQYAAYPSTSHPLPPPGPPPGHPAYPHHHPYYGSGPLPPPPVQGYGPYPPPHPHYPPPGMYANGHPPIPHPSTIPLPHNGYPMPPPVPYHPQPHGIPIGTQKPTSEPNVKKTAMQAKSENVESEPQKKSNNRSEYSADLSTDLSTKKSPESVDTNIRQKKYFKQENEDALERPPKKDTAIVYSRDSVRTDHRHDLSLQQVKTTTDLSPTPVTTHRKRDLKSIFDPPPQNKSSPVQSFWENSLGDSHGDDKRGRRKRSRHTEDFFSETPEMTSRVAEEQHLQTHGSPYDLDDELGCSPIKFHRHPKPLSFGTSGTTTLVVKADEIFPDETLTGNRAGHDIHNSPSELSMASRDGFDEHILNEQSSWEYSAIDIQDNRHHHRQQHRRRNDEQHYSQTQSSRWRDANSGRSSSHGQDDEYYHEPSSLYHEYGHSVDRSSYRHGSKDDLGLTTRNANDRSSGTSSISRSGDKAPKSSSTTEFSRQFFD